MNSNTIIVDLQGFKNEKNDFILKEMAIGTKEYTQTFLVKPPCSFSALTVEEKKRVRWIEKNRGLRWSEGYIDLREFKRLIKPYLNKYKIIVKGEEKVKWVREICNHENVIDISSRDIPNLDTLSKIYCKDILVYNCFHHSNYCALRNVICVRKWIVENNVSNSDL